MKQDFSKLNKFNDEGLSFAEIKKDLKENSEGITPFGISYLDQSLEGIERSDLILIGAASGRGKTQLCSLIASNALSLNKRVHFFALEAERFEIGKRLMFLLYAQAFYSDNDRPRIDGQLIYSRWRLNRYEEQFKKYDESVAAKFAMQNKNLKVFYRANDFGVDEFVASVASVKNETDLVILDHLNYFDFVGDNENKAISQAVKAIRALQINLKIPIMMAAHVRKKSLNDQSLVPAIEEFHGSSDIFKVATKTIMLAPCFEDGPSHLHKTFVQVGKHRHNGSVTKYTAKMTFNISENSYEDAYEIGTLKDRGSKFDPVIVQADLPFWATGATITPPSTSWSKKPERPAAPPSGKNYGGRPYRDN